jgi:hypothetical protein
MCPVLANLFFMAFFCGACTPHFVSWRLETSSETTTGVVVRLTGGVMTLKADAYLCPIVEFEARKQNILF